MAEPALTPGTVSRDANADDVVVLLDGLGRPAGTAAKSTVHHRSTPLHLAFSCYAVDAAGRVLLTRRAPTKRTWPGTWTNACCGHPRPGERVDESARRRLHFELGLTPVRLAVALPDFAYRAEMADGTVEKELCPVLVAQVAGEPRLNPAEADDWCWVDWPDLLERARTLPESLSPWSVRQILRLAELAESPADWLTRQPPVPADGPDGAVPVVADPLTPMAGLVDDLLEEFVRERGHELHALDPAAVRLGTAVSSLLEAGGKRIRPAFVYWGHRATGAAHDPAVAGPAAATELLHAFALLHDDVMDRSATRRRRPTAHRSFANDHRDAAWTGEPDWFGTSAAILAGDLAAAWADQMLASAGWPPAVTARAQQVFAVLRAEVTAGQFLDLRMSADPSCGEADALRAALLKAGRYTVTRPLELGATLAGAGPELLAALRSYGDAAGLAFQLRDDLLGLVGDPLVTGKSGLDDLREGKRTLAVLRALELAAPSEARRLDHALGSSQLSEAEAAGCRAIILDSGAVASVEARVAALHRQALQALTPVAEPARSALGELSRLAAYRSR